MVAIYRATEVDGFSRDFALYDQIRRAAGSIMHNIAEDFDGGSNAEFLQFPSQAKFLLVDESAISRTG